MCQNFSFRFAKSVAILTLILSYISLSNLYAQWEIINDGSGLGWLNTIDFVNEDVGWIGGGWPGTLLKTTDGGENWNSIPINESGIILQIDFLNESVGWAVTRKYEGGGTQYSALQITSNGGNTWEIKFTLQLSIDLPILKSIYAIDEFNVFAVGGGMIYKTTNGGTNWLNVSPNLPARDYTSIWFQDPQTGVVVGNYKDGTIKKGIILKTTNGGTNWNETFVNEFSSIYDLQFLNGLNGYFRAHKDTTHYICKTDNIFLSWTVQAQKPYEITSYHYLDNNNAYAIMGDSLSANNVMKSTDGGVSWQKIYSFLDEWNLSPIRIYFTNSSRGNIIGSIIGQPTILRTDDNGFNWSIQNISYPIIDVYFFDETYGFITGGYCMGRSHCSPVGNLLSSSNGGKTWNIKLGYPGSVGKSLIFYDNLVGFSLASWFGQSISTEIYKTTDGGYSWFDSYINNSLGYIFSGNDILFRNNELIYAVGSYIDSSYTHGAGILTTIDGGDNWNLSWTDSTEGSLNSICFIYSTGWTVGESGMIVKYTPQTGWIQQPSVTDLPLNKVFFTDDNYGWIAGGYHNIWSDSSFQSILLKTTNGGVNWTSVPNIPYLFRDIVFIDNNLGWAIGYDSSGVGGILKTTDGGLTWELNVGDSPAQLNALHIKDNYGWAVGEKGLILRTTDNGAVWVEDENDNVYPTEFVLEQNFPNPFNPSTVIGYRLPVISKVTLKVYDVLGREIRTLVNQEQPAGVYEVVFHPASSIQYQASGVYFYQLNAGTYSSTKKMLFLK